MLGANEIPRLVVTFLVAFFPLVISISTGFINLPDEYRNLAFVYKTTRYRKFLDIELPYAVPYIFSGLKMAATLAVVGAVTAEFVNADKGLGYLIVTSTAYFKTTIAFGAVVILSLLGIGFFQLISVIENIFLRKYRG